MGQPTVRWRIHVMLLSAPLPRLVMHRSAI